MSLVVAHRGACLERVENTLEAFEHAHALGADMIELDVQLSADGQVMVFHDDLLTRLTDVERRFPERSAEPLCRFRAAELALLRQGVTGERAAGPRVPTLAAVLDWARGVGMALNIETKSLKRVYPGMVAKVTALVADRGMEEAVLISSFNHVDLLACRAATPALRTGVLAYGRLVGFGRYAKEVLGAAAINPSIEALGRDGIGAGIDATMLEEAQELGLQSYVWTVNDAEGLVELGRLGVTGVITDDPALGRSTYDA